jgi:hypothetical protein
MSGFWVGVVTGAAGTSFVWWTLRRGLDGVFHDVGDAVSWVLSWFRKS